MNNNKTLIEAINEYYRLKNNYSIKNYKPVKTTEGELSKKKCLQCNGVGGILFQVKNEGGSRVLLASCQANPKCDLNIRINTGQIVNLKSEIKVLTTNDYQRMIGYKKENNTNYLNKEIIIAKNDILYGYERIERVEDNLRQLLEDVDLQNYAVTSYKTELFDITENNTTLLEIQDLKKSILDAIGAIKKLITLYNENHTPHLLEESDEIYKKIILPKSNELRNKLYTIQQVESCISSKSLETIYTLIQEKYHESSFEIQLDEKLEDIVMVMGDVNTNNVNKTKKITKTKKVKEREKKTKGVKDPDEKGIVEETEEDVVIRGKLKTSIKKKKRVKEDMPKKHEVDRETIREIPTLIKGHYTDTIIFCIYDKSPDVVPGKGKYEKIPEVSIGEFKTLETFTNWRTRLSNTHHSVFVLDNHKWYSVYHYYVACQFKLSNPEFYVSFSMDSGSPISRSITKAREASDMSKDTTLRSSDIEPDADYYSGNRHLEELFYGTYANIDQHEDLKRILINTRNAKLMRYVKKDNVSKFVIDTDLLYIRFLLNSKEREIDEMNAKKNDDKMNGGGVRFGGSQVKYIEPVESSSGEVDYTNGIDADADEYLLNIGGELSLDTLDIESM